VISYRSWGGYARLRAAALDEAGWVPWARDHGELEYLLRCPLTAADIHSGEEIAAAVLALARLTVPV
jgi:hypothetical protein